YVFTWDSLAPNGLTTSIARNSADLQRVKHWFDTDSFPSCLLLNVGTNQIEKENNFFNVYPNPAHDKLYVQLAATSKQLESYYEVLDLFGRIVFTGKLNSDFIDLKNFPGGIYILQMHEGETVLRKKFVKQ
ncbi:MAG: T9SS type A sorting domain-containing protein, partial [Bacteroidia bacterium]